MVKILQAEGDDLPVREGDVHGIPNLENLRGGPSLSHSVDVCGLHNAERRKTFFENSYRLNGDSVGIGGVGGLGGDCPRAEPVRVECGLPLC